MYYTYFCRDNYAKLLVISFFVLFGFFSGCSKNDIGEPKKEIPEIVKEKEKPKNTFVIFTFSDSETKNFDKNIGAFCSTVSGGKKYFNLTQKNGKWGAEIDEKDLKGGKISLYYPVRENKNSNTASVKVMSDQSTESNFEKSSFYFGQVPLSEGKEVEASIKNIMYELEFDFQGDVPEDLSVELECSLEGEIKLSNGEIEVSKPEMQRLTPYKKENGKYAIRIIPQSSNPQEKEKQSIKFVWENGKKSMDYIISDKIEGAFEKGGKKSLDVILKSKEEEDVFVNFSISQEDKSFDDKSVIGVFSSVNKKSFTLTKEGNNWLPQVNKKDLEGGKVSVFYPVNSILNSENYSLNIIANQSKKDNFEKSKFYFAQKTFENENFDISPKNVMHEIEIHIKGNVPNDLSIKVKSFLQGNLSLLSGEIAVSKTNKSEINPYKIENGKYTVLILPQLTDSYKTDKEFITFTWNKGKDKMKYALPAKEGKSFVKGEKTILEVTLKSERKEEVSVPKDNKEKEGNKEKETSTSTDKDKDKEGKSDNVSQGSGGNTSVAPKVEEKYVTFNLKKGKEDFEEGSVVGVFNAKATSDAKKYFTITKKGGKWTPEINVKDLEDASISFYYPVGEKATSNMYSISAETNQGSQGRFEKSKFYFGQTTFGKGREEITSTLQNVMHELEINIEGKIPVNLVVRLEGNPSGKINLTNGDVTVSQGSSYSMIPHKLTDRKYSIVILPQSAALYKKEPGLVSFSWKGGKKYFTLKDAGDFLGKNKKTVLNVVLEEEKPKESVKEKEDTPTNSGNTNNPPKKEDKNKDEKGTEGSNSATSGTTPSTGNSNANNGGSGVDNSSSNSANTGATSSDKDDHTSADKENTNPKNDSESQGIGGNNPKEKETKGKDKEKDKEKGKDDSGTSTTTQGTNNDSNKDKETTPNPVEEFVSFSIMKENSSFADGSIVGVFCPDAPTKKHFTLTKEKGKWKSSVKRNELGNGKLSFYYPAKNTNSEKYPIRLESDQRIEKNYEGNKFYFAQVTLGQNDKGVDVTLKNIMHELEINIGGNVPDEINISLGSIYLGNISLTNGEVALTTTDQALIKPYKKSKGKYSVIIIPQPTSPYKEGLGLMDISWNNGSSKMRYKFSQNEKTTFEKGGNTKIDITLKEDKKNPVVTPPKNNGQGSGIGSGNNSGNNNNGNVGGNTGGSNDNNTSTKVDEEFKNKSMWVYGVKAPEFPVGNDGSKLPSGNIKGQWIRGAFDLIEIRWERGAGWYDVNKAKSNEDHSDNNLCWAAASSNMLHWWLEHNKDYIKKYNEKYPEEPKIPEINYDIPEKYSEIFDLYTKTFVDRGSWTLGGINWFITGKRVELPASRDIKENEKFKGYFSKVFGNGIIETLTQRHHWPNKERFNRIIKDALKNNKGLCFDVNIPGYANHAMTIWGAEFDEKGDVSHIYYCDNNSSEEVNKEGICVRRRIVYKGNLTYYLPGDNEKYKNQIITIYSLDLGKKIWEKELNKK